MNQTTLPGIMDRMKAMLADGLLIVAAMFFVSFLFEKIGDVDDSPRFYVFIFLFIIYDPLLTSFGGTLGHRMNGLRVKQERKRDKNINIFAAMFRFVIKACLGWISLIAVSVNSKGMAIHDMVAGSIVVYKKPVTQSLTDATPAPSLPDNPEILDQ